MDNDGRHHSWGVKELLRRKRLDRLGQLPSNSPDLSPIENLWHQMKVFVRKLHPTNEDQLKEAVFQAYEAVDRQALKALFDSMPVRMQAVIDADGDRINY